MHHADYHDYAPAGNAPTAFIGAPVVGSDSTLLGAAVFSGPGIMHDNQLSPIEERTAETLCRWLNRAFSKGKSWQMAEIRKIFSVPVV